MNQPGQCAVIPAEACATEFQPVCGCDGKMYANDCAATKAQTKNHNVSQESPRWTASHESAALARPWQTAPIALPMGRVVLRYAFAHDGKFELQFLDAAHMDRAPASTKNGTYSASPMGALKLVYADRDGNGTPLTGELALEQLCADGFRISGHDGLPNTDVELKPTK